jgi:hypothetical protein
MNKKSLNAKEVNRTIQSQLEKGISRQEILNELGEIYFDKKSIARLIASIPDTQRKLKFRALNNVLLGLLIATIITKILVGIAILSNVSLFMIPIAFLLPIITILFAYEVANFKGYIYRILGILAIAGILKMLSDMESSNITLVLIDVFVSLIIAGLAFYIGNKVFPNYGLFGPKKALDGQFLLS